MKFRSFDHARAVSIDLLELGAQVLHLLLGGSLNKKIHGGLLERWNAFEIAKSSYDIVTDLHSSGGILSSRLTKRDVKDL